MKSRLWFLFRFTSIRGLRRHRRRHRLEAKTRSSRSGGCCAECCWWPEKRQKWWIWVVTSSSSSRLRTNESNFMVRLRRLGQTFGGSSGFLKFDQKQNYFWPHFNNSHDNNYTSTNGSSKEMTRSLFLLGWQDKPDILVSIKRAACKGSKVGGYGCLVCF